MQGLETYLELPLTWAQVIKHVSLAQFYIELCKTSAVKKNAQVIFLYIKLLNLLINKRKNDHNILNRKGSWGAYRVSPQYLQSLWVFSRFNTMNSDRKSASTYLNNYPIRSESRVRVQDGWTVSLLCIRRCLE